jgi:hypothetical protein
MDIATATPVEIDTALADIYSRYYKVLDKVEQHDKWVKDYEDGLAKRDAGNLSYSSFTQGGHNDLVIKRAALIRESHAILAEAEPYDLEFTLRGRWNRFFLVQNNGGHIHSSMSCSTCRYTTRFGWLPQISGQTEAEAVAAHGAILCTVCYPSAPTEWTDRHDDSVCPGSGKHYDTNQPSRTGFFSGNWGVCTGCGERQTVSKVGNIRKHKK